MTLVTLTQNNALFLLVTNQGVNTHGSPGLYRYDLKVVNLV